MSKLNKQIKLIIEQIDETSFLLEQNKDSEAYPIMIEIVQLLNLILPNIIQSENKKIYIDQNKFIITLTKILEAMEVKDNLLLADFLQYELKKLLIEVISS